VAALGVETNAAADVAAGGFGAQLVIHSGDIDYSDGYMSQREEYMDAMEPVASRVTYLIGALRGHFR
jgi:hypothetical protein